MSNDLEFGHRRRSWIFRPLVRDEVDAELAFHLDMRTRHYEARGYSPDDARRRAAAEFGSMDHVRRDCERAGERRDLAMRRTQYLDELGQDVRFALRQLRRAPLFALVALATLALGIGATTAMFSLVRGVLLEPLAFQEPERLVVTRLSMPDYRDLRQGTDVFARTGVFASNLESLTGSGEPEQVLAGVISPELLETLGVDPLIGRRFTIDDGTARLILLSHGLWQRRFGGDPAIVGRTIELSRVRSVVIGVMPSRFEFPTREFELWTPMANAMSMAPQQNENRALRIFQMVGRIRPGVSLEQAQASVTAISTRLARDFPDTNRNVEMRLVPAYERLVGEARQPLLLLLAAVGLVLLIVCANLANLLLARATTRERELGIRRALGAGRGRLVRQLLTESLLLGGIGGLLGIVMAWGTLGALVRLVADLAPRVDAIRIDAGVLLFAVGLSLSASVLFGLAPILQQTSRRLAWRTAGRGIAGTARGGRLRSLLIGLEVAIAIVVLVSAGLLVRSLSTLLHVDPGFVPERLLTMNVVLVAKGEGPQRAEAARGLLERLRRLPGVESAGGATALPPQTAQRGARFELEGIAPPTGESPAAYFIATMPGYFDALGTPVGRGRAFDARDVAASLPVAIVNKSLARRFFGGADPIGRRIKLTNPEQPDSWRTIVGVVPDIRYQGLEDPGESAVYTPFAQTPFFWIYVFVRTHGDPGTMTRTVAQAVRELDPELMPARIQPMTALVGEAVASRRASTMLVSGFAAIALLLSAIGIAGLVSYGVAQRTPELAVRLALGATPGRAAALVVGHALAPVAGGALVGLLAAMVSTRLIESQLFGVSAGDGTTIAAVVLIVTLVTVASACLPARRALKVSPIEALRAE
jgi:putative ABC transport system permease protein